MTQLLHFFYATTNLVQSIFHLSFYKKKKITQTKRKRNNTFSFIKFHTIPDYSIYKF